MYSNMLSKFNMFEHNETMNIMKHKDSLQKVKPKNKKNEHKKSTVKEHFYCFYYFLCEV